MTQNVMPDVRGDGFLGARTGNATDVRELRARMATVDAPGGKRVLGHSRVGNCCGIFSRVQGGAVVLGIRDWMVGN